MHSVSQSTSVDMCDCTAHDDVLYLIVMSSLFSKTNPIKEALLAVRVRFSLGERGHDEEK